MMVTAKEVSLESMIASACDAKRAEPDVPLNFDIVEVVKAKASNSSEALRIILPLINGFSRHRAWLALSLLDILAINAGYAFRMLLARRDTINRLAVRFPAKPAVRPDELQQFILYLLKKWRLSFCETAMHKEDFANIRAMYELLLSKRFKFPDVSPADIDCITAVEESIQGSKEATEQAEKERMAAKLDFLLLRGSTADLNAANELMKVLVGYEDKTDGECMDELLGKLTDKLDLLETLEPSAMQQSSTARRMYDECKSAQADLFKYGHHPKGSAASKQQAADIKSRIGALVERVERSDLLIGDSSGSVKLASTSLPDLIDVGEGGERAGSLLDSHVSETTSYEVIVDAIIGVHARLIRIGNLSADTISRLVLRSGTAAKPFVSVEAIEPGRTSTFPLPPEQDLMQVSIEYRCCAGGARQFTANSLL